jgi:hypothetical protein
MWLVGLVRWRSPLQPIFNLALSYRKFIGEVVADPALRGCDIVHIMSIPQFLPFFRRRLPKARIVYW